MSQDWELVCNACKSYIHLGQIMAGIPSFGYGSNDEEGRKKALNWISEHLGGWCQDEQHTDTFLRMFISSDWEEQPEHDTYHNLDDEKGDQE